MLAFTATAGRAMQQRILESLAIPDADVFVSDVDRPNIAMVRWNVGRDARAKCIAELLSLPLPAGGKAMVFVPSTRVGNELKQALAALGMHIPLYHSRLGTPWEREQLVKRFTNQSEPRLDTIIATSAFGMGLDVSGTRLVIHWQPRALDDYLQELAALARWQPAWPLCLRLRSQE
jgi:superfamily II DNA helicase RecQ